MSPCRTLSTRAFCLSVFYQTGSITACLEERDSDAGTRIAAIEDKLAEVKKSLESEDKALARRIIQQFVAKIVLKEGTGTLYYTFPFPDASYMPGFRDLDLRGSGTLTGHILRFDIPLPASTESDLRNPDKEQLRADILTMLRQGMSYRKIGAALGIHWTRVGRSREWRGITVKLANQCSIQRAN